MIHLDIDDDHYQRFKFCGSMYYEKNDEGTQLGSRVANSEDSKKFYRWIVDIERKTAVPPDFDGPDAWSCVGTVITER